MVLFLSHSSVGIIVLNTFNVGRATVLLSPVSAERCFFKSSVFELVSHSCFILAACYVVLSLNIRKQFSTLCVCFTRSVKQWNAVRYATL